MKRQTQSLLAILALTALAAPALADVKREGEWPKDDKKVSLDVTGVTRAEAVRRVSEAAGFSVVAEGIGDGTIDLHVKEQPAGRVLDLVLDDRSYVATRDGDLVRVRRAAEPVVKADVAPAAAPEDKEKGDKAEKVKEDKVAEKANDKPAAKDGKSEGGVVSKRGEDRTFFGSNARIEANETVRDVTVFGGNVDVYGTVTGDLSVFGGNVHVRSGARVAGDASVMGGNLDLDDGATVEKDISVLGGSVHRSPGAKVGGSVHENAKKDLDLRLGTHGDDASFLGRLGHRLTNMAILFVFGTILLALASTRMESMSVEIAARPMRTFALGVVSFFGAIVAAVVLCVTIIGIPIAAVGALLAVFGGYAGAAAALTTFGAAILRHRTPNPYAHLAFGCVVLFLVGLIPAVGGFVTAIVGALGLGALLATRGAGLLAKRDAAGAGPYRTA